MKMSVNSFIMRTKKSMKNLSISMEEVMICSAQEARDLGNLRVSPEHLLMGLIKAGDNNALNLLQDMGANEQKINRRLRVYLSQKEGECDDFNDQMEMDDDAMAVMERLFEFSEEVEGSSVGTLHLLYALLERESTYASKLLQDAGLNLNFLRQQIELDVEEQPQSGLHDDEDDEDDDHDEVIKKSKDEQPGLETPMLDNFCVDLTKAAEEKRLDPIIGREKELMRMSQILCRRKKNNPMLIGDPGVGKSALVEGLAQRIADRKVSRILFDKRIFTLDLTALVAGTKYRGQFEERIKGLLREVSEHPEIILFIDEIHTIVGAGSTPGSLDAANMLKPSLARGEIQCIGATTLDEYREHIEKDGALERRFQKIIVDPTSPEESIAILKNIKDKYEEHHNVSYSEAAIEACVELTRRYITDRNLPDKAIDALDEAGAGVHMQAIEVPHEVLELEERLEKVKATKLEAVKAQDFELAASHRNEEKDLQSLLVEAKETWAKTMEEQRVSVDDDRIAEVVGMMSGIPVQRIAQEEGTRLLALNEQLKRGVIGQDMAIEKLVRAIKRNRVGLKDPNRPIGTFIFIGPTGVGKTHLAKVLAEEVFDSPDALIRVDMSEYMEKFAVSRLVGAPPGYVGYEEGGQLTERVRRKPYSVILLDEIEKAHADVYNILLQLLDEGYLTDSLGRKVDFRNTIIIMTSNVGSRQVKEFGKGVGFTQGQGLSTRDYARGVIEKALHKTFAPEFINRLDDIILFDQLDQESINKIIELELKGLYNRLASMNCELILGEKAKLFIASKGYDVQYGARPLKRAIQEYLEDPLADLILQNTFVEPQRIEVDKDENEEKLNFNIHNNSPIKTED